MERSEPGTRKWMWSSGQLPLFVAMAGLAALVCYMWVRFYPFDRPVGGWRQGLFCAVPYGLMWLYGTFFVHTARGRWMLIVYMSVSAFSSVSALLDFMRTSWPCGNSLFPPLVFTHFVAGVLFLFGCSRALTRAVRQKE